MLLESILIVDDDESDIAIVKYHLNKAFENVVFITAFDRASFVERLEWITPSLIISDFRLGDCSGLDLLMHTKRNFDTPFIFHTEVLYSSSFISQAIIKGADGYLLKENVSDIGKVVKLVLENYHAQSDEKGKHIEKIRQMKLLASKAFHLASKSSDSTLKDTLENLCRDFDLLIKY